MRTGGKPDNFEGLEGLRRHLDVGMCAQPRQRVEGDARTWSVQPSARHLYRGSLADGAEIEVDLKRSVGNV